MSKARCLLPHLAGGMAALRRAPAAAPRRLPAFPNRSLGSLADRSPFRKADDTRSCSTLLDPVLNATFSRPTHRNLTTRTASSEPTVVTLTSQPPSWTSVAIKRTFATTPLGMIMKYATGRSSFDVSSFRRSSVQSSRNSFRSSGNGGRRSGSSWWTNFKDRLDGIPPMRVVYGLIAINVGVFLVWQYAMTSWQRFRDPALYYWMTNNFIVSEANLMAGRIYTLLTCCFSHSSGTHIMLNMLGLYFIAPATVGVLGTANFLGLYLGAGIISSLVSLAWHRVANRGRRTSHGSEGASGAIYACLSFFAATFPQTQFLMFFVIPMPAWVAVGGIFAYDLYTSIAQPYAKTDSAGHIGGMMAGVAYALLRRGRGGRPRSPFGY